MPDSLPLKILFFGDIVGKPGRRAIAKAVPELKKELKPDLVIANAENLAHGLGVTRKTLSQVREAGIDFFTTGNHVWEKPEIYEMMKEPDMPLIRPANYGPESPGQGYKKIMVRGKQVLIVNLSGQVFLGEEFDNPFKSIDYILRDNLDSNLNGIFVDFHAEATSEKVAFGWHLDGRVSAVVGTHTHVPTADERILPKGTAYISDVGMVGLRDSVIGIDREVVLNNFIAPEEARAHMIAEHGICIINAVIIEIDSATRRALKIARIAKEIEV